MGLEYIYAALMLHEAKKDIDEKTISGIVKAAGIDVNEAMVKATIENLKDVDIEEVLNSAVVSPVAAAPAAAPAGGEAAAEKKEDKKEDDSKKEEEAAAGLGSLFG